MSGQGGGYSGTVLVTGAIGFLGTWVVCELLETTDADVVALTKKVARTAAVAIG